MLDDGGQLKVKAIFGVLLVLVSIPIFFYASTGLRGKDYEAPVMHAGRAIRGEEARQTGWTYLGAGIVALGLGSFLLVRCFREDRGDGY